MGTGEKIMFGACLCTMLLSAVFCICQYIRHRKAQKSLMEGAGSLSCLYPAACVLHEILRNRLHVPYSEEKLKHMQMAEPGTPRDVLGEKYDCQRISYMAAAVFILLFVVMLSVAGSMGREKLKDPGTLTRAEPGEGEKKIRLEMRSSGQKREILLSVPERKYQREELQAKLAEAKEYILAAVPGANPSLEQVTEPLSLPSGIPDSQIKVRWKLDNSGYVNRDGTVNNEELEGTADVMVTAVLVYEDTKEEVPVNLTVCPKEKSRAEKFWEQWDKLMEQENKKTEAEQTLQLPGWVGEKRVRYREIIPSAWKKLLLMGLAVCGFMPVLLDYQMEQRIRKRERQLKQEYPEIVERFILLLGAGLTIRGAWQRIVQDYEDRREKQEIGYHYLYEEMILTRNEMENGQSEEAAYTAFGRRILLLQYMKFSTLLVQNLKKGSDDLLKRMNLEAEDALRTRRELAKKLGEEAGTRLLVPMMMMLCIVFALIMMAAFQAM